MNFDLTEDQKMLAKTVADFAKQSSPVERFRKLRDDERGWEPKVWKQMGELGWLSVPFPESLGGFGGTFVEVSLVLEKMGTTLIPEPYIPSVALAGMAILHAGTEDQQKKHLEPMIEGQTSLALAYAERGSRYDLDHIDARAEKSGDQWALTGEKVFVLNGHAADQVVISARTPGGVSLFVVDRETDGLDVKPIQTIHGHRAANLRFEGLKVGADRLLGEEGQGLAALERALDYGAVAACAEGQGIVETMLDMSVEYLKEREQFGVKIGVFQALQHRAVDMFVQKEVCRSLLIEAAALAGSEDEGERRAAVSAAKVQLATGGKFVSQQAIQLHGGIGITDEHDIGLYFKRLEALNRLFGDEAYHADRYSRQPSSVAAV